MKTLTVNVSYAAGNDSRRYEETLDIRVDDSFRAEDLLVGPDVIGRLVLSDYQSHGALEVEQTRTVHRRADETDLKQRLTPDFLDTLRFAVGVIGWSVDAVETTNFAEELYKLADTPAPKDLGPFEYDENQ